MMDGHIKTLTKRHRHSITHRPLRMCTETWLLFDRPVAEELSVISVPVPPARRRLLAAGVLGGG